MPLLMLLLLKILVNKIYLCCRLVFGRLEEEQEELVAGSDAPTIRSILVPDLPPLGQRTTTVLYVDMLPEIKLTFESIIILIRAKNRTFARNVPTRQPRIVICAPITGDTIQMLLLYLSSQPLGIEIHWNH